ncbi:SRPBCC family protein [Hyalangium minutum]|uniref:Activator of Hsp90 ATPase homologue 1/2-like C-terminal domain-containing protein n=1 Tax=Hyalangium minutum TaxID=394096 RepID=A0A085WGD8_9BACT|nr:SRPBCC domain-containing protein [Hyalangium minutum]KFE66751.1 hypothetical protein DB31_8965 [Hyalangium minutum]
MSELMLEVRMEHPLDTILAAFEDPFRLRRWVDAPPGCYRTGGESSKELGEPSRISLVDAQGTPFFQTIRILSPLSLQGLELEMSWEGGGLDGDATHAAITFKAYEGGTQLHLRQGPFSRLEALETHRAYWEHCFARLARIASGEAVPCFEEFCEESQGFDEPLGFAAYTVLVGMREAGAPAEVISQVEEALYAHLPRLSDETAGVLAALLRFRLKEPAS